MQIKTMHSGWVKYSTGFQAGTTFPCPRLCMQRPSPNHHPRNTSIWPCSKPQSYHQKQHWITVFAPSKYQGRVSSRTINIHLPRMPPSSAKDLAEATQCVANARTLCRRLKVGEAMPWEILSPLNPPPKKMINIQGSHMRKELYWLVSL